MSADELASFPHPVEAPSVAAELGPLIAEGRILDSVTRRDLRGSYEEIAAPLGVTVRDLQLALEELARIAWVEVERLSEQEVLVRLAEDARTTA